MVYKVPHCFYIFSYTNCKQMAITSRCLNECNRFRSLRKHLLGSIKILWNCFNINHESHRSSPLRLTFKAIQKCALCAHNKVTNFAYSAKFARVKANINQSQNKHCLRNNLAIISTPKIIPCKQPPFTVAGP